MSKRINKFRFKFIPNYIKNWGKKNKSQTVDEIDNINTNKYDSSEIYLEILNKVEKLISEYENNSINKNQNNDFNNDLYLNNESSVMSNPFNENFTQPDFKLDYSIIDNQSGKLFLQDSAQSIETNNEDVIENDLPDSEEITENSLIFESKENDEPIMESVCSKNNKVKKPDYDNEKWVFTGISGFDNLLQKGIPAGSNIIVAGGPGCGKTIFCSQLFYNNASKGKDCVFLSMEERPDRLMDHMFEFGFNIEIIKETPEEIILCANGKGKIALKRLQPLRLARSIEALLEKASGTLPVDIDLVLDYIPKGFEASLLALDSISAIETAFSGTQRQYRIYIEQLFRYFEEMNITTFMITESTDAPHKFSNTGVEEFLADGIFVFYNFQGVKKRTRGVEIYKLRGASHSQRIVPMTISNKGMEIESDQSCKEQTTSK